MPRIPGLVLALLAPAIPALPSAAPSAPTRYTVTDLGFLPDPILGERDESREAALSIVVRPTAINSRGQVVGYSYIRDFEDHNDLAHAFLWEKGRIRPLKGLDGKYSRAYAINDRGEIAGDAESGDLDVPVVWRGLGARPTALSRNYGSATGINARGDAAGLEQLPPEGEGLQPRARVFRWGAVRTERLPVASDRIASVAGLTDDRTVFGTLKDSLGAFGIDPSLGHLEAFRWTGDRLHTLSMGGRPGAEGLGVTTVGQAAGLTATANYVTRACRWTPGGRLIELPAPADASSRANGINGHNECVGRVSRPGNWSAYLWSRGQSVDLNDRIAVGSGWVLTEAIAINDRGQIIGTGRHDGKARGFLLDPVSP